MNLKIWLIIIAALIVIAGSIIASLLIKKLAVQVELEKANATIATLQGNLNNANMAYVQQNMLIENMKLDTDNVSFKLKNENNNIEAKYKNALNQAKIAYENNKSCQTQLELIFNAQKEFLNEWQ